MHQISTSTRPTYSEQAASTQPIRSAPIPLAISEMQEHTEYLISALGGLEERLSAVLGPPRMNEDEKRCAAPTPAVSGLASVIRSQVVSLQQLRQQVEAITNRLEV